jgi:hypothetical protein
MVTGAKGYIGRNFINKYGNEYHLNPVSLSTSKNLDFSNVSLGLQVDFSFMSFLCSLKSPCTPYTATVL